MHATATAFYAPSSPRGGGRGRRPGAAGSPGVRPVAAAAYGLGYAPAGWTASPSTCTASGHPDERCTPPGSACAAATAPLVDRFRDRLMFPVHHPSGSH